MEPSKHGRVVVIAREREPCSRVGQLVVRRRKKSKYFDSLGDVDRIASMVEQPDDEISIACSRGDAGDVPNGEVRVHRERGAARPHADPRSIDRGPP